MHHQTLETDAGVTLEPAGAARACVVWLHGLGADGYDFVPLVAELGTAATRAVRFVFPHAPPRPVTINGGYVMRAWYDITALTPEGREDADGLEASTAHIGALVAAERARGIPAAAIVLAGFSQGGAVALHATLRTAERLAGCVALSTYLPRAAAALSARTTAGAAVPVLMCHGQHDPIVPLAMGRAARDALAAAGQSVEWHEYPVEHALADAEVRDVARWLEARLA